MNSRFIFLLLLVMAGLVVAFAPLPVQPITPQERTFRIEAGQFAYSPSELKVNPGDKVTFQLVSTDVVHGLYVDGYDISIQADPGQTRTLSFVADKSFFTCVATRTTALLVCTLGVVTNVACGSRCTLSLRVNRTCR
jgi:plastocyanin